MSRKTWALYEGQIKANKVGAFVMGGETFHIVRPGFDIQGRKRTAWTQVCHDDIPIFTVRMDVALDQVMGKFETEFDSVIKGDVDLLTRALDQCKREHRRKFKDGVSGIEPAATLTGDGRGTGRRYSA